MTQITQSFYNIQEAEQKVSTGGGLKQIARSFFTELNDLMVAFADTDLAMTIDGIPVAADNKYGILGTTLMSKKQSDLQTMMESSINSFNTIFDLEKQVGKLFSG